MEGDCILFSSGGCAGEIVLLADCKRDISKHLSKVGLGRNDITDEIDLILCRTGVCRECRRLYTQHKQASENQEEVIERNSKIKCSTALHDISAISMTPRKINQLLYLEGQQPLSRTLQTSCQDASKKTQNVYKSRIEDVITTVIETIAPVDAGLLWCALKQSPRINKRHEEQCTDDSNLLMALVESYNQASDPGTRKNILSVMTEKLSFDDLEKVIPDLSRHRFNTARRHGIKYGADALATQISKTNKVVRQRFETEQVEHFITFITGQNAIQDLPFGLRKLKLSTGEEIEIPNVIRLLIPSRLVDQYLQYCRETCTLLKIISESCTASVRKCMKGLDNYLAEGTSAIDDLVYVVDKLSEEGMTEHKATDLKSSLVEGKQYLKGDYKVWQAVAAKSYRDLKTC